MDFDLIYLLFIFILFSKYWWTIPTYFLLLVIYRLFFPVNNKSPFEKCLKEAEEREERQREKELRLQEKEALKEKYPEVGWEYKAREQVIRRLSYHERTGHITEPEKELLEVLRANTK